MKTYIYNAKSKEPLRLLNFGVGDVVSLRGFGGVYPSYTQAYGVFGKNIPDGRGIRFNVFKIVGFILHSNSSKQVLAAVGNDDQFFIVDIGNIKPYCNWSNSTTADEYDIIYVNNVDYLVESDRISDEELKPEFDRIISAQNGEQS